jgi:hypothetical protein
MPGLPKLLLVVLVLAAGWYVKRWLLAMPHRRPTAPQQRAVEDLVACRICGAYTAAACGRLDCPQR